MRGNDSEPGSADGRPLRATPETEDFRGKYESGMVGQRLLSNYFRAVGELVDATRITGPTRAIEIGCGEGLSTQRVRHLLPDTVRLVASEYVGRQVELARENNPGLEIVEESIYDLTHENGSFDVVFLLEVLEHLDHPQEGLTEVARVLKPGGFLIAGVPREPLWRVLNVLRGKYLGSLGNTPGHLNHWSIRSFVEFLSGAFGDVEAVRSPIPWVLTLARRR